MGTADTDVEAAVGNVPARNVDLKLEVVVIPVSNVDRARDFYVNLGWRVDADVDKDNVRLVQLTPQGSACSVQFGTDITRPSRVRALALPGRLRRQGGTRRPNGARRRSQRGLPRSHPRRSVPPVCADRRPVRDHASYGSFASFSDPDGNTWLLQEITQRLPGRIDSATTSFASATDLENALRRASAAHGDHEKRLGQPNPNWPKWYADYMVAEQTGKELPS